MNSIASMHIPRVHPCSTFRIQIGRQLHRASLVSRAFPWLSIILYQSTVDGECVSKLIFLWELLLAMVVLRTWNRFWTLVLRNLLATVVYVLRSGECSVGARHWRLDSTVVISEAGFWRNHSFSTWLLHWHCNVIFITLASRKLWRVIIFIDINVFNWIFNAIIIMIDRLSFNQCIKPRWLCCLTFLLPASSTDHILSLVLLNAPLFLFIPHNLLMNGIWQIRLLNRSHVLNLWYDLSITHVLKHNLRITNDNWICNVNGIAINSAVGVVCNVLSDLWLHSNSLFTVHLAHVTTHLHRVHWILWFQWPVSIYDLLRLLRTHLWWSLMQLITLIICNTRISSKMFLRILRARLLALHEIVLYRLQSLRWHLWSLVLMMFGHLLRRCLVEEVIQVQLLLVCGLTTVCTLILEAVLAEFWEVLEVVWLSSVRDCLWLFLVFDSVKALTIDVFFLFRAGVHMIDGGKFHLGVLSSFVSSFRASLMFVITSVNCS